MDLVVGDPPFSPTHRAAALDDGERARHLQISQRRHVRAEAIRTLLGRHVLVVDTEFTGIRIVELGLARLFDGYPIEYDGFLIDPGPSVRPASSVSIKKRTLCELAEGAGQFIEHGTRVTRWMTGSPLMVGWCRDGGDSRRLNDELLRVDIRHDPTSWVDAAWMWSVLHDKAREPELAVACEEYGLTGYDWHLAGQDARATADLLGELCLAWREQGRVAEEIKQAGWLGSGWQAPTEPLVPVHRRARRARSYTSMGASRRWLSEQVRTPLPRPVRIALLEWLEQQDLIDGFSPMQHPRKTPRHLQDRYVGAARSTCSWPGRLAASNPHPPPPG